MSGRRSLTGALGLEAHVALGIGSWEFAFAWHLLSRLLYVVYAGATLKAWDSRKFGSRVGGERYFERFRRRVSFLMQHDAASLITLVLATRSSLPSRWPLWVSHVTGVLFVVMGLGCKL